MNTSTNRSTRLSLLLVTALSLAACNSSFLGRQTRSSINKSISNAHFLHCGDSVFECCWTEYRNFQEDVKEAEVGEVDRLNGITDAYTLSYRAGILRTYEASAPDIEDSRPIFSPSQWVDNTDMFPLKTPRLIMEFEITMRRTGYNIGRTGFHQYFYSKPHPHTEMAPELLRMLGADLLRFRCPGGADKPPQEVDSHDLKDRVKGATIEAIARPIDELIGKSHEYKQRAYFIHRVLGIEVEPSDNIRPIQNSVLRLLRFVPRLNRYYMIQSVEDNGTAIIVKGGSPLTFEEQEAELRWIHHQLPRLLELHGGRNVLQSPIIATGEDTAEGALEGMLGGEILPFRIHFSPHKSEIVGTRQRDTSSP